MATTTRTRKKKRFEISSDKAREILGSLINRAAAVGATERVVLTRHGLPVVALVSIDDLNSLEAGEAA